MILDCHVHIKEGPVDQTAFLQALQATGVDGALLTSLRPKSMGATGHYMPPGERLKNLLA